VFGRFAVIPPLHHSVQISNRINSPLGFSGKQRFHDSPDNSHGRTPMKTERCMTQTELAERGRISEADQHLAADRSSKNRPSPYRRRPSTLIRPVSTCHNWRPVVPAP